MIRRMLTLYSMTKFAIVVANVVGFWPVLVGASVDPKADTIKLIPLA